MNRNRAPTVKNILGLPTTVSITGIIEADAEIMNARKLKKGNLDLNCYVYFIEESMPG